MLFAYEPALQPSADFLKAKFADKVRFERFDEDGHALFLDDPVTFNRMIDDFITKLAETMSSNSRTQSAPPLALTACVLVV